jgi:hypothetical protein
MTNYQPQTLKRFINVFQIFKKKNRSEAEQLSVGDAAKSLLQNEALVEGIARVQDDLLVKFHQADITDPKVFLQIQADRKAFDSLLIHLATIAKEAELIQLKQ